MGLTSPVSLKNALPQGGPVIIRFFFVCIGAGMFVGGLGLSITGIGAIFGLPMMALGLSMVETNASTPRR